MLLRRFYDESIAQASYLIACQRTGEAIVVDPNREVEQYVNAASAAGVRITHVTETHIHADFVSGSRQLAQRTGAALALSDCGPADWRYAFAESDGARLLVDGDTIRVGNVVLEAMHTPGHTPEHLAFLVTDTVGASAPMGLLSGDFIFVGDVGRPDLLESAAGQKGSADVMARQLFHSLQRVASLPDWLQLWPGHGAGSACGKALGAVPQTTLGYERLFNWAFGIHDEDEFVRAALEGQSTPPKYFARMKRVNRDGPAILAGPPSPSELDARTLAAAVRDGAIVVDTRPAAAFAADHLAGTISIPLGKSFMTWAGALLDGEKPLTLIAGDGAAAIAIARQLRLIGIDGVESFATTETLRGATAGKAERIDRLAPAEVHAILGDRSARVIDVRAADEWAAGHLPGAENLPLGTLPDRLAELPRDRPIVLQCQSGMRSIIAASLLQRAVFTDVRDMRGGFAEWSSSGLPVERQAPRGA
jgi:hydroxyacylglutathione hydrolase